MRGADLCVVRTPRSSCFPGTRRNLLFSSRSVNVRGANPTVLLFSRDKAEPTKDDFLESNFADWLEGRKVGERAPPLSGERAPERY